MGADIHLYMEYSGNADPDSEIEFVRSWCSLGGCMNPGRDYDLFAKIANVRGEADALVPLRGLPENIAYHAKNDNLLYICDEDPDADGHCSMAQAESYVKYGSKWVGTESNPRVWVTHPDWHSHTWLTPAELRAVLEAPRPTMPWDDDKPWPIDARWWAILAALEDFERQDLQARAVIWFDN